MMEDMDVTKTGDAFTHQTSPPHSSIFSISSIRNSILHKIQLSQNDDQTGNAKATSRKGNSSQSSIETSTGEHETTSLCMNSANASQVPVEVIDFESTESKTEPNVKIADMCSNKLLGDLSCNEISDLEIQNTAVKILEEVRNARIIEDGSLLNSKPESEKECSFHENPEQKGVDQTSRNSSDLSKTSEDLHLTKQFYSTDSCFEPEKMEAGVLTPDHSNQNLIKPESNSVCLADTALDSVQAVPLFFTKEKEPTFVSSDVDSSPQKIKVETVLVEDLCFEEKKKYFHLASESELTPRNETSGNILELEMNDQACNQQQDEQEIDIGTKNKDISTVDYRDNESDSGEDSSDCDSSSLSFVDGVKIELEAEEEDEKVVKKNSLGFEEIRTPGELFPEELPPLEELTINIDENTEMQEVGVVSSIIGVLVVIKSTVPHPPVLDETVFFTSSKQPLGQVFEVFGPVQNPFYSIRFNSVEDINAKNVETGMAVYFAPAVPEITHYVFVDQLKKLKGSDASWKDNNEPPPAFIEYSDDEEERKMKAKRKGKRANTDGFGEINDDATEDTETKRKSKNLSYQRENQNGVERGRGRGRGRRIQDKPGEADLVPQSGRWPPSDWSSKRFAPDEGFDWDRPADSKQSHSFSQTSHLEKLKDCRQQQWERGRGRGVLRMPVLSSPCPPEPFHPRGPPFCNSPRLAFRPPFHVSPRAPVGTFNNPQFQQNFHGNNFNSNFPYDKVNGSPGGYNCNVPPPQNPFSYTGPNGSGPTDFADINRGQYAGWNQRSTAPRRLGLHSPEFSNSHMPGNFDSNELGGWPHQASVPRPSHNRFEEQPNWKQTPKGNFQNETSCNKNQGQKWPIVDSRFIKNSGNDNF